MKKLYETLHESYSGFTSTSSTFRFINVRVVYFINLNSKALCSPSPVRFVFYYFLTANIISNKVQCNLPQELWFTISISKRVHVNVEVVQCYIPSKYRLIPNTLPSTDT